MKGDHNDDEEAGVTESSEAVAVVGVSWMQQLKSVLRKNLLLLSRRPIQLVIMLFSSALSSLLAWTVGHDTDVDFGSVPLTDCGTVQRDYLVNLTWTEQDKVPLSYNDNWRDGTAIALMALGPSLHAIVAFLAVHNEIQSQMLGVLRGIGLRESVFWTSWWLPFLFTSIVNAIIGAITAKIITLHVFGHVYFMGIMGSIFFLNMALVSASFFCASLWGTTRGGAPAWVTILFMLVAVWVPLIVQNAQSLTPRAADLALGDSNLRTPTGLFWVYFNTTTSEWRDMGTRVVFSNGTSILVEGFQSLVESGQTQDVVSTQREWAEVACERPIISETQGRLFKFDEQRSDFPQNEWFVGCSIGAGYYTKLYKSSDKAELAFLFFFPYIHFSNIWANFLGYTGMPGKTFSPEHASWSAEKLAVESLPVAPNDANGRGGTMFEQGSTLHLASEWPPPLPPGVPYERRSNCPLGNMTDFFCGLEFNQCMFAPEPSPTTDSPSVLDIFGYLMALSLFYMLMASYWAQVFPGKNGAPLKPYFFLLPGYWWPSNAPAATNNEDVSGVHIQGILKKYGEMEAVKNVTMTMTKGEVIALLGHNGAGKTTLSSIIGCEIMATEGDVSVFGHSVARDAYGVRRMVGVCRQDDYLYPNLSAKEHLQLFAGLRGVPKEMVGPTVAKWLESVDLSIVQDNYSASFSGGMKRRLSVALSTIGDRPMIILDEPTTGMDPVSRRFVWKHVDEIKDNRVVLLTTHAMEEADLLADSVAIMRKGELAAIGSPLQLKSEYGSALQFSVLVEPEDVDATAASIKERFGTSQEWLTVTAGQAGNITVKIDRIQQKTNDSDEGIDINGIDVQDLADFVAWLENKEESKVSEYGFSNSSLEEVFLKVTEGEKEEVQEDHGDELDDVDVCCSCCCKCCLLCCLKGPCRCCCRPRQHTHESDQQAAKTDLDDREPEGTIGTDSVASFRPVLSVRRQVETLVRFSFVRSWLGRGSIVSWVMSALFILATFILGFSTHNMTQPEPLLVVPASFISLMLVNVVSSIYSDRQLGLFYLMRTQGVLKWSFIAGTGLYTLAFFFLFGLVLLSLLYATPLFRSPTFCDNGNYWCTQRSFGSTRHIIPQEIWWWDDTYNGVSVRLFASWEPGGYGRILGAIVFFALTMPGAVLASSYLPGYKFSLVVVVIVSLFVSLMPLILRYNLHIPSEELEEHDNECTWNVCNVTRSSFTIGNLSTFGEEFLDCVGVEINNIGGLCVPSFAAILPQIGLFQALSMTLVSNIKFQSNPPEYLEQVLIPSLGGGVKCNGDSCRFPFARRLYGENLGYMVLGAVILMILGIGLVSFFSFPGGLILRFKNYLSRLYKSSFLCLTSSPPEKTVDKTEKDDASDSSEPLEEVLQESELVESLVSPFISVTATKSMEEADEDGETAQVNHDAIPRDELPPVVMHHLRKVYPSLGGLPPKIALESLDLHVPKGQVLGLLGKNGAGKTTALKILSISHNATDGLALVAGYDVSREETSVFERLGNCPQFDIIWPGLSVGRHLEFFASMKGLPRSHVREIAKSIAAMVGLGSLAVYNRQAGQLSGGMRRRLSIAISLIGAPSVLLLDEPSTGLDPSTRNSIWKLVNSFATKDRAIIITTHMMLEADTLCNRIAIMSRGRLKVVATQQSLKDRFGSGYLLQLNLVKSSKEYQDRAMSFVQERLHENAILQTKQARTLRVALPRDIDLKKVFRVLYSPEASAVGGINQFLLSQSSLEDVFIAVGDG